MYLFIMSLQSHLIWNNSFTFFFSPHNIDILGGYFFHLSLSNGPPWLESGYAFLAAMLNNWCVFSLHHIRLQVMSILPLLEMLTLITRLKYYPLVSSTMLLFFFYVINILILGKYPAPHQNFHPLVLTSVENSCPNYNRWLQNCNFLASSLLFGILLKARAVPS